MRMRSYLFSSLCAVIAGLMNVAQSKDSDPQFGLGAELVVIASVIVGGAAIFGGRGRVIGSCMGAIFVGLVEKVLREGVPIMREIDIGGGEKVQVAAVAQLPPGGVSAVARGCSGACGVDRAVDRPGRIFARAWAFSAARRRHSSLMSAASRWPAWRREGPLIEARGLDARGLVAFFYRRDAAAIMLVAALWLFGLWARPDFWGILDNSFAILLAFSEIALLTVGLTFVMANGDIDLSVGSVLALSGATAAVVMKDTQLGPLAAAAIAIGAGVLAGAINGWLTAYVGLPSFIATLGTFYWARGIGSSIVAGTQLNGFPESFNLIGRSVFELLDALGLRRRKAA